MVEPLPGTKRCECEHECHFGDGYTPNGNPAHRYGPIYNEIFIVDKVTPYGIFHVCRDCANDCYQDYETRLIGRE